MVASWAQGIRCVFKNINHCRIEYICYIYLKYFSITVLDLHAYLMGPASMLTPHQLLRKRNKQNRRINYLRSN